MTEKRIPPTPPPRPSRVTGLPVLDAIIATDTEESLERTRTLTISDLLELLGEDEQFSVECADKEKDKHSDTPKSDLKDLISDTLSGDNVEMWKKTIESIEQKYSKQSEIPMSVELELDMKTVMRIRHESLNILQEGKKRREMELLIKKCFQVLNMLEQIHNENLFEKFAIKMPKKDILRQKITTSQGMEELIRFLVQEVSQVKAQLAQESKRRCDLEVEMNSEMMELNKSLLYESSVRKSLQQRFEEVSRLRHSILGELAIMKGNLEIILGNTEVKQVDNISKTLEAKLSAMEELSRISTVESLTTSTPTHQILEKIISRLEEERNLRDGMEEQNYMLEEKIKNLERQINEEKTKRRTFEKQMGQHK